MHDALSHVVIPAFDIKRLQPTIFSTYEVPKYIYIYIYVSKIFYIYACNETCTILLVYMN